MDTRPILVIGSSNAVRLAKLLPGGRRDVKRWTGPYAVSGATLKSLNKLLDIPYYDGSSGAAIPVVVVGINDIRKQHFDICNGRSTLQRAVTIVRLHTKELVDRSVYTFPQGYIWVETISAEFISELPGWKFYTSILREVINSEAGRGRGCLRFVPTADLADPQLYESKFHDGRRDFNHLNSNGIGIVISRVVNAIHSLRL